MSCLGAEWLAYQFALFDPVNKVSFFIHLSNNQSLLHIPWNLSFRYIHCTGQFTPKMKANAEPRLLSSLVWIDSCVEVSQHRLESFFHEIKCNGMTSFMEFKWSSFCQTVFTLKQRAMKSMHLHWVVHCAILLFAPTPLQLIVFHWSSRTYLLT